ncbi:hypothetical protein Dimus_032847 [Dionaea muscipula]
MGAHLPNDFRCPISLEVMSDPVILSSGHTFDRSSIQRWLDSGHRTCPITKLPLPEPPFLIPNHTLRSLISSYSRLSPPPPPPDSAAAHYPYYNHHRPQVPDFQALISSLSSPDSSLASKLESLGQLSKLLKNDPGFHRRLTESGAVSAVLRCVDSEHPGLQEKALSLLLNLSLDDDNKVGMVAEGAIGRVLDALTAGSPASQALAATMLTSLAVVEVNKATIGAYPEAIKALVSVLRDGKGRERKEAATALYTICSFPENRRRAVEAGAVPVLILVAELGLERAVEVLGSLAKCREGRHEMMKYDGVVEVLVGVLRNGSSRGVQCALLTLNSLCSCCERLCSEARYEGAMEICFARHGGDSIKGLLWERFQFQYVL